MVGSHAHEHMDSANRPLGLFAGKSIHLEVGEKESDSRRSYRKGM